MRIFLALGVLGGTALALGAGLWLARRAMAPITALTATARRIEETRDPTMRVPVPATDDEIAELARTLDGMLHALDAAREETEATLTRQRQFVADASHELRTPLTSVLANLELLAEVLEGERGEAASSALRSSRRMRRLVGDLLLLARADANRQAPRRPTDLAQVAVEAAAELGPVAERPRRPRRRAAGRRRRRAGRAAPARAEPHGERDPPHAPRGPGSACAPAARATRPSSSWRTTARASRRSSAAASSSGSSAAPATAARSSSSGLGLSIVRAVAESHGGTVDARRRRARGALRRPPAARRRGAGGRPERRRRADREQPARALSPAPGRGA